MADDNDSTSSGEKRSRFITESVTATFDFKVTNYPELKGTMVVGEYISSPIFRVGGHRWTIKFFPNGEFNKYRGKVSAYLYCLSGVKDVIMTKFTLELLHKEDQVQHGNYLHEICATFSGSDSSLGWGHHRFANEKKLRSLSLRADGCFTIRCVLTVMESSPLLELHSNIERMLRDGVGTDVTFIVGGQPFRAHRAILAARSPIFEAQVFDPATEKHIECVEVVDIEPAIFKMLLHFVYTDLVPPCSNDDTLMLQRLLVAADRYDLDRLKLMCEDELIEKIDVKTVRVTFALADRHNCKQLRSVCLNFMACPKVLDVILASDGLKNLHLGTQ